jgi:hypothetical protein
LMLKIKGKPKIFGDKLGGAARAVDMAARRSPATVSWSPATG